MIINDDEHWCDLVWYQFGWYDCGRSQHVKHFNWRKDVNTTIGMRLKVQHQIVEKFIARKHYYNPLYFLDAPFDFFISVLKCVLVDWIIPFNIFRFVLTVKRLRDRSKWKVDGQEAPPIFQSMVPCLIIEQVWYDYKTTALLRTIYDFEWIRAVPTCSLPRSRV